MSLSSETRELLTRTRRLLARSWTSGHLFRRNPKTNKPEYCLMGGILRSAGVKPVQMVEPQYDMSGREITPKSKAQKIVEWSQFPPEAKVAMKALAVTILENDSPLARNYINNNYRSEHTYNQSAAEYINQYPEEAFHIIAEYNDEYARSKADIKRILSLAVESD